MSVLDHQKEQKVQLWNGVSYSYVSKEMAEELESNGTHQITTNLSADKLMTPKELTSRAKEIKKQRQEAEKDEEPSPSARTKRKIQNREAKPSDPDFPYETK